MLAQGAVAPWAAAQEDRGQHPLLASAAMAEGGRGGWDFGRLGRFFDSSNSRGTVRADGIPDPKAARAAYERREVAFTIGPESAPAREARSLAVPNPIVTPAYRRTFRRLLAQPQLTDRYDELVVKYAKAYKLDPRLLKAIIAAESQFVPRALSPKGARGLMQVMPKTAEGMGVDGDSLHDPESNIQAGAAYVAHLFQAAWTKYKLKGVRFQDGPIWLTQRVIAAYNAGPKFLWRKGGWYNETKHYVRKVMLFYRSRVTDIRRSPKALAAAPELPAEGFGSF